MPLSLIRDLVAGRGELTDAVWERIAPLLPVLDGRGRPWRDHRQVIDGGCGACGRGLRGGICRSGTGRGRRFTSGSSGGSPTVRGPGCWNVFRSVRMWSATWSGRFRWTPPPTGLTKSMSMRRPWADPPGVPGRPGGPARRPRSRPQRRRAVEHPLPGRRVAHLRAEGHEITDEDVARLSPLKNAHVNFLGCYCSTSPPAARPKACRPCATQTRSTPTTGPRTDPRVPGPPGSSAVLRPGDVVVGAATADRRRRKRAEDAGRRIGLVSGRTRAGVERIAHRVQTSGDRPGIQSAIPARRCGTIPKYDLDIHARRSAVGRTRLRP
jgi:hypothetical protein